MALLEGTAAAGGATLTLPNNCTTVYLKCKDDSPQRLLVTIPGTANQYPLEKGEERHFRFGQVSSLTIAGEGGNATYKWMPVVVA